MRAARENPEMDFDAWWEQRLEEAELAIEEQRLEDLKSRVEEKNNG